MELASWSERHLHLNGLVTSLSNSQTVIVIVTVAAFAWNCEVKNMNLASMLHVIVSAEGWVHSRHYRKICGNNARYATWHLSGHFYREPKGEFILTKQDLNCKNPCFIFVHILPIWRLLYISTSEQVRKSVMNLQCLQHSQPFVTENATQGGLGCPLVTDVVYKEKYGIWDKHLYKEFATRFSCMSIQSERPRKHQV
jgi:hypothetical protein